MTRNECLRLCLSYFGVSHDLLKEPIRQKEISERRFLTCAALREMCRTASYPIIANIVGYGHHTSAMHAIKRVHADENLTKKYSYLRNYILRSAQVAA